MKRFAGGGGRPGARPTFNWKERRALGLPEAGEVAPKTRKMGDFDDIAKYVSEDAMLDVLNQDDGWELEEIGSDKKVIHPSNLFGAGKGRGKLLKKRNYNRKTFSHTRIFGKSLKSSSD